VAEAKDSVGNVGRCDEPAYDRRQDSPVWTTGKMVRARLGKEHGSSVVAGAKVMYLGEVGTTFASRGGMSHVRRAESEAAD
jgi:hypothetical protein